MIPLLQPQALPALPPFPRPQLLLLVLLPGCFPCSHHRGQRGLTNRKPLEWETRFKMVYGAARGVAHIHSQSRGKLVHGNIKSSNIFLNAKGYGCISGAGMATLMHSQPRHAVGFRAPEITDTRKVTQFSDVYSFGVLIFEVLTGKPEVVNLVRWVNSVVREEWTGEVFRIH